jgi:hypothetical protein
MKHLETHNPITGEDWKTCSACYAARTATFAHFSELAPGLGPHDWDEMIERMKEIAQMHLSGLGQLRVLDGGKA